jgi:hypothetical protein
MSASVPFVGVIEGFFGQSWSWDERTAYAPFLRAHGYSFYIYAPKDEPFLRKRWNEPFPVERLAQLSTLFSAFKGCGTQRGVGLSPYEAYRNYDSGARASLREKVKALNTLSLDILCVLFDDMRGDVPALAETQIRILADIREVSTAPRMIFCPTYYSYDPIIERCFGPMPPNYLEDLGRGLDRSIDLFWTGERVMSSAYPAEHLKEVAERMCRKPFLWDNYPVNDSKRASPFLFLKAFENRGPHLAELVSGHAINPMKQPFLSQIPLASLRRNYEQSGSYDRDATTLLCAKQVCGDELGTLIAQDLPLFHDFGLDALNDEQKAYLRARYEGHKEDPYCREILLWLDNGYQFDPACLTD